MKTSLNYGWHFKEGFSKENIKTPLADYEEVDIPHSVKRLPVNYFDERSYQGIYSYEKYFDAIEGQKRFFLHFDGLMLQADLYLNGNYLGHFISGWVQIEVEITSYIQKKNNRLLVVLDTREDENIPPFGKAVDYLTFGGIYRGVSLLSYPENFIKDVIIEKADKTGLKVSTLLEKEEKVTYSLSDKEGKLLLQTDKNEFTIENLHLWSLEDPYLYTLKVSIPSDERTLKVGFRTIRIDQSGFYLNEKKIKLIGLNRHQNYPFVGPSLPKSAQREDALLIKELGCNIVRTSHYPQSEDFLSCCDEIGLLVLTEVPGWQHVSMEETWRKNFLFFIEEMVKKERNHPSLIAYGVRVDESKDDDELYSKANEIVHQLDCSRVTTGVRNFKDSNCLEDFYSYNDFSCSGLSHGLDDPKTVSGAKGKALLDTENNGHMYPSKMYDPTNRRTEHALRHLRVMNDAYKYDGYLGEIAWCAFDYNTHKDFGSGDHICYHGVMDIYRNKKDCAYAYLSQKDENPLIHVTNIPVSGDQDEANFKPFVVFSNCDEIKLYRNEKFIKTFYPLKKEYPYLKHPPFLVDDFIGETFSEGLNKKDSTVIARALNYVGDVGMAHVEKKKLIKPLFVLMKNHVPLSKVYDWYSKYISCWGEKAVTFKLVGYNKGTEKVTKILEPSVSFDYQVTAFKKELVNEETYDVARVSVLFVDQNHIQQHYAFPSISLETEGPIECLSPDILSLQGGSVSFYVRSHKVEKEEKARLIIHTDLSDKVVEFSVR